MHNNVKFVLRDEDIQVWWSSWYSEAGGGRLCLSACPGDGKVKKLPSIPLRIISGTALTVSLWNGNAPLIHERQIVDDITPALAQLHWLSLRQ